MYVYPVANGEMKIRKPLRTKQGERRKGGEEGGEALTTEPTSVGGQDMSCRDPVDVALLRACRISVAPARVTLAVTAPTGRHPLFCMSCAVQSH